MKTKPLTRGSRKGYALIMVATMAAISMLLLAGTMNRTATVAHVNDRNNQFTANQNVAEAAVEKAIARVAYDFQTPGLGLGAVVRNLDIYRTNIPTEDPYWNNFEFSDGQGHVGRTYVAQSTHYSGPLPSQYPGLFTIDAPVYRVLSNVRSKTAGAYAITNAVQVDVLLALVPLTQYAIFYNTNLLEFSTCATMTVNGRTHANANIYVGSSSPLTFNGTVTTTGTISAPANSGYGPWAFPGNVSFNGSPTYKTNVPTISVNINMTNTHSMIDLPPAGEGANSPQGAQRLYNQAQVVLMVTNNVIVPFATNSPPASNTMVTVRIQNSVSGQVPGADPSPTTNSYYSIGTTNWNNIATNLPFLSLTNKFLDQREDKIINATQIDMGKYADWSRTNLNVLTKFPSGSGTYPTILYAADVRNLTATNLTAIRITNGIAPPKNGGLGFSLATPNPVYVWGNYNCTNAAHLASTNTSSTVPSALMADALTILSSSWKDATSYTLDSSGPNAAAATTVNAAILTGIKPSTGTGITQFSGGVHNLPRLLEDWGSSHLWINTSIINLFNSAKATGQFIYPSTSGSYYVPPTRHFSFDINFLDPTKQPPGMPCALVLIRMNWAVPPPNSIAYNVTP